MKNKPGTAGILWLPDRGRPLAQNDNFQLDRISMFQYSTRFGYINDL